MLPDNIYWNIWQGDEVEGENSIGVKTIFIRKLTIETKSILKSKLCNEKIFRVWLEDELNFEDIEIIINLIRHELGLKNVEIVLSLDYNKLMESLSNRLIRILHLKDDKFHFYLKLKDFLKKGDVIGTGARFEEEFFNVGSGQICNFDMYLNDSNLEALGE